jgi:hypothetical protein
MLDFSEVGATKPAGYVVIPAWLGDPTPSENASCFTAQTAA